MFSEVMEWEAKGDGLRRAGRLDEAVEAYRRALRHCVQWTPGNDGARACSEIREKIWTVRLDQFDGGGEAPAGADAVEWTAAMRWAEGDRAEADRGIEAAAARGFRTSGEFLDRLAARWLGPDPEGSLRLTAWARRLRGESGKPLPGDAENHRGALEALPG